MVVGQALRWGVCALAAWVAVAMVALPAQARERHAPSSGKTAKPAKAGKPAAASPAARKANTTARVKPAAVRSKVGIKRSAARSPARRMVTYAPPRPSFGQLYGLHATHDPLSLKSSVALVLDQDTHEVLLSKNSEAVLPIASITKLMTAVIVTQAGLPLDEVLTISVDDVDTEKGSRSRLAVGTRLTREEMLHLALMSSENRAANALGRHYPGGLAAFVEAMNHKAAELGMHDTRYVEPTGLSSRNQSSARDLATLVGFAYREPLIRQLSTSPEYLVAIGERQMQFRNTNALTSSPLWNIGLQKTGYIAEAGRCLVMQASLAGRQLILVFLDSNGRYSRIGDAERVRQWLTGITPDTAPVPDLAEEILEEAADMVEPPIVQARPVTVGRIGL